jgi:hypothetical protein
MMRISEQIELQKTIYYIIFHFDLLLVDVSHHSYRHFVYLHSNSFHFGLQYFKQTRENYWIVR